MKTSIDVFKALGALTVGLVLAVCMAQSAVAETTALRILLTNDDGYDTPGIKAVRSALMQSGHDVTLVAPLKNQSSSGARVTSSGVLEYKQQSEGVWSVEGFPADAVLVGLLHIMKDNAPDLVVSGANFGQNPGYAINSGTVGAATVAMYAGFPAIAISVAVDYAEVGATPYPFPSTLKAFPGAAELLVDIVGQLQKTRFDDGALLAAHTILNVNYPPLEPENIKGVRVVLRWKRQEAKTQICKCSQVDLSPSACWMVTGMQVNPCGRASQCAWKNLNNTRTAKLRPPWPSCSWFLRGIAVADMF
jgi:5'/3'-nucleotidase SurE